MEDEYRKSFRLLSSYKAMHMETAEKKGVLEEFKNARNLTRARIVLFGSKQKQINQWNGRSYYKAGG